jgi:hypothetical protein
VTQNDPNEEGFEMMSSDEYRDVIDTSMEERLNPRAE